MRVSAYNENTVNRGELSFELMIDRSLSRFFHATLITTSLLQHVNLINTSSGNKSVQNATIFDINNGCLALYGKLDLLNFPPTRNTLIFIKPTSYTCRNGFNFWILLFFKDYYLNNNFISSENSSAWMIWTIFKNAISRSSTSMAGVCTVLFRLAFWTLQFLMNRTIYATIRITLSTDDFVTINSMILFWTFIYIYIQLRLFSSFQAVTTPVKDRNSNSSAIHWHLFGGIPDR